MGQAKNRGTRDARVTQALGRAKVSAAPVLKCNACQAVLTDVTPLDTRDLKGIAQAYGAHCAACEQDTWAVRGDPAAVRAFYAALEKAAGQKVQLGTAKPAAAG